MIQEVILRPIREIRKNSKRDLFGTIEFERNGSQIIQSREPYATLLEVPGSWLITSLQFVPKFKRDSTPNSPDLSAALDHTRSRVDY